MSTITAQEFAQIMRDAIAQIQPGPREPQAVNVAAPVVNVEQPEVNVEVDVDSIVQQLRALRGAMVRPSNLRGIVQQVKELGTVSKSNTSRVVKAIEDMASTAPTQEDIQRIVDELLEVTAGVEMISEDVQEVAQAVNSVANIMNPYREMTREQLIDEFKRMGIRQYQAFDTNTQQELSRKLNFVKLLDEQAEVMAAYRERTPGYVPRDMQRLSVDTYASFGQRTARGIPLDAKYMYLPKSIPASTVRFNQKTGMYEMSQDGITDFAKAWRDAERWALSGGSYSDEMKALRKIRDKTLRRDPEQHIIFQARKI